MRNPAVALASLLIAACNAGPHCDHDAAEAALAAAEVGETVLLGACEIQGPLHVPPGVHLAGTTGTVVVAPVESGGIVALGGATPTEIRDLSVRVEGRIGILLRGGGAGAVRRVTIDAVHGIALGASELASLELVDVSLRGPVNADNADDGRWQRVAAAPAEPASCPSEPCECTPGELDAAAGHVCDELGEWATWTATFGLVVHQVVSATLSGVEVSGFAAWGAVLTESSVAWSDGAVRDTLGIGIRQVGGTLSLTDVTAERTHAGLRGDPPYAIVATDAARLDGARLTVGDNDRFGVLLSGATGRLEDLVATDNRDVALSVVDSDDFELLGTGSHFADNAFAGIVVVGSSGVRLEAATIEGTRSVERLVGVGVVRVGDGVQVTQLAGSVALTDLVLDGNERVGVLVELDASGTSGVTFTGVAVSGTGAQLGALAGRSSGAGELMVESPAGWDAGITRAGAVSANDLAFSGSIPLANEDHRFVVSPGDVLGVVAPMF